jgi:sulfopyruvate decarboxylase TPP-binding subunit
MASFIASMCAVIVNAVGIVNRVNAIPGFNHANSVFNREHRQTPVVVVAGDNGAETQRIDLPVPLGRFQVRVIFLAVQQVIVNRRPFRIASLSSVLLA